MSEVYQRVLLECANDLGLANTQHFAHTGLLQLDDNIITIEYLGMQSSYEYMMFYSKLGHPDKASMDLFSTLLEANMMWRGTGGATLGLDADSGNLFLSYQHRLDGLTGSDLAAMLKQFNQIALYWRKFIGEEHDEMTSSSPNTIFNMRG